VLGCNGSSLLLLLCRYRHNANYAELVVMPSRAPGTLVRRCARPEILGIIALQGLEELEQAVGGTVATGTCSGRSDAG
jgi:hypothetical protein